MVGLPPVAGRSPLAVAVVVGPDEHGVVRHAVLVATAAGMAIVRSRGAPAALPAADVMVVAFADGVFGGVTEAAADAYERMTDGVTAPMVVVLHDLPTGDDSERSTRRRATYRRVARRAQHLIVASEHERALAVALGAEVPVSVVPLPIVDDPVRPEPTTGRSIGVLGFVYPGKGHDLVLAAAGALPADVAIVAGGAASAGHEDLVAALTSRACATGRSFTVTGPLDDTGLRRFMATTTVPVVPAPAPSASMSLSTWIGAGRRPVVVDSAYAIETAALVSGTIDLVHADSLAAALVERLADPARTWRSTPVPDAVGLPTVAATIRRIVIGVIR